MYTSIMGLLLWGHSATKYFIIMGLLLRVRVWGYSLERPRFLHWAGVDRCCFLYVVLFRILVRTVA